LALEEHKRDDDMIVEANGTRVVYTKELDAYIENLTLDYTDSWFNKGFRLTSATR